MSAECHCREKAQNQEDIGKRLGGLGGVGSSEWKVGWGGGGLETKTTERQGESGQSTAPGATAVAASNWSTSQPPLLAFSFIISLKL